jgi:hypothetical protein
MGIKATRSTAGNQIKLDFLLPEAGVGTTRDASGVVGSSATGAGDRGEKTGT